MLLARIDGADPATIARILPVSREDASLETPAMREALQLMQRSLEDAYWYLPERHGWRKQRNLAVERSLRPLLWADVAVALIGDGTLPRVAAIPLRRLLMLYALIVEQLRWDEVVQLTGCTNWELRRAIFDSLRAVGGTQPYALPFRARKSGGVLDQSPDF